MGQSFASKQFLFWVFVIYTLCFWVTTGTLAPYAATIPGELIDQSFGCDYPLNVDHPHFKAVFKFLSFEPKSEWAFSVTLRRFLHPLLALPFMSVFGFEYGGIIFNFLFTFAFIFFVSKFYFQEFGQFGARVAFILLSTYPGIFYWTGVPYSYAIAVPVFFAFFLLLRRIILEAPHNKNLVPLSLALGALNFGYDVFPYALPSVFYFFIRQKQVRTAFVSVGLQLVPLLTLFLFLQIFFKVSPGNANSDIYKRVLGGYIGGLSDLGGWLDFLLQAPWVFVRNFLDSNFLFIPVLFLVFLIIKTANKIRLVESENLTLKIFFGSLFFVWAFNNLAPPYYGWQMRGTWIPRLYQPLIAGLLTFVVFVGSQLKSTHRILGVGSKKLAQFFIGLCVVGNLTIVFGPLVWSEFANRRIYSFYAHLPNYSQYKGVETKSGKMPEVGTSPFYDNLKRLGRRPLGICPDP